MGERFAMPYVLTREESLFVLHLLVEGNASEAFSGLPQFIGIRSLASWSRSETDFAASWIGDSGFGIKPSSMRRNLDVCSQEAGSANDRRTGRSRVGDQYLYIALDEETKLVPSFAIGKRTLETTELFMGDLAVRIVVPPCLKRARARLLLRMGFTPIRTPWMEHSAGRELRDDH